MPTTTKNHLLKIGLLLVSAFLLLPSTPADEITQNDFTIRTADKDGNYWDSGVYSWGAPVYVNVVNNKASARQASIAAVFGQSLVSMKKVSVWDVVPTVVETITETCEQRNATTNTTTYFDVCWHNTTVTVVDVDQWVNLDFSGETDRLKFVSSRANHSGLNTRRFRIDFDQPKNTAIKFNISINESGTFSVLDPVLNSTFTYYQNVTYNTSNGTAGFPTATVSNIVLPFKLNATVTLFTNNQLNSSCFDVIIDNGTNALTCEQNQHSCRNTWDENFWQWCNVNALSGNNSNTVNWGSNTTTNQSQTGSTIWGANATLVYLFDGNTTINTANAVFDSSGDANHGQLRNFTSAAAAPTEPCLFGACPNFSNGGASASLCVPDSNSLDMAHGSFTAEFWVTHLTDCTTAHRLYEKYSGAGYTCVFRNAACDLRCNVDAGSEQTVLADTVSLGFNNGSWHHIMLSYANVAGSTQLSTYFDGKRIANTTFSGDTISASTAILRFGNFGEETACTTAPTVPVKYPGALGYFALWDKPLDGDYAMTKYRQYLTQTYSGVNPPAAANVIPTVASVAFNTTYPVANSSLNCSATPTDATNTSLLVNFSWYKNGALQFIAQSSCLNNTKCNSSKVMPSINKTDVYVCGANVFDGTDWSAETNSTSLTVTLPLFSGDWASSNCYNITNTGGQDWPINTSINITLDTATQISNGKMRSDCGDVRVEYNSVLETSWVMNPPNFPGGVCNNAASMIVFKTVNTTPAGGKDSYCVWYNASTKTYTPTNASAFIFFDDFNRPDNNTIGNPIIGSTWVEGGGAALQTINSNQLRLNLDASSDANAGSSFDKIAGVNLSMIRFMFKTSGSVEAQGIRDPSRLSLRSDNGTIFYQVKTNSSNNDDTASLEHGEGGIGLTLLRKAYAAGAAGTMNFTMINYSAQNNRVIYLNQSASLQGTLATNNSNGYPVTNIVNNVSLINVSITAGSATPQFWVYDDLGVWMYPVNDTLNVSGVNVAPTVNTPTISPTTAFRYDDLNCSVTASDVDGGSLTVNFSWYKNGALQFITNTSCTAGTLCNSSKLMVDVNRSETYACGARAFDATTWSAETNSTNLTVSNTAPNVTASNFSNTTGTYINTTLTANTTYTDLDSDTGTVFFNWSVNGVEKRLVNFSSVGNGTVLNDTFTPGNYTRSDVILLNISATDSTNSSNIEILTRTVSNYGPANTSTVLNASSAVTGDDLNCSTTPSDPENSTLLINFSWYKNGVQDISLDNQVSCTNSTTCNASKIVIDVNESDNWFCRSTVFDGGAWSNLTNSTALTVSNSAPAMQSLTPTSGTIYSHITVSVACNATDIDLLDDITYDISGFYQTLSQGSQSWQSIVTGDADGLFSWDITSLASQSGVDLNCSASDGTVSNLSFNPTGTLSVDRAPNITLVNISPDVSAFTNQTLNCSATVVDDLAASMNTNFTWYNNLVLNVSTVVSCGNNTLCNGTGIPATNTTRAQNWTCAVTTTDGVMNASSINDSVLIVNTLPYVQNVTLFPSPVQPNTKLNCSAEYFDIDADSGNVTFAFYKNAVLQNQNGTTTGAVNGSTINSSNTVPASGVQGGDVWSCSAQAVDVGGNESVKLNSSSTTVNSAPVINVINTVPSNLSSAVSSTAYWFVNVTDANLDTVSYCNLTLRWPNQSIVTNFDNVNLTKSANADLWNSSNVSITVGGYYNATINCSDASTTTQNVSLKSAVSTIINITGENHSVTYFDSAQFIANWTTDDSITSAYINLTWPNGSIVQYNMTTLQAIPNKTYHFNSTNVSLTQGGAYSAKYFALTGTGDSNVNTTVYSVGSDIFSSPDSIITTPDPRQSLTVISLSLWQNSALNLSYNLSGELFDSSNVLMNAANFSFNFSRTNLSITGPKTLNNSDTVNVQINASSVVSDGLYTGNITIKRLNDSATNTIPITIGINPPAGKVLAVTSTDGLTGCSPGVCDWKPIYTAPGISQSFSFFVKNSGNFTLSNCQVSFTDDIANASWLSVEGTQGFSVSINQTVVRNVRIQDPPSGSWFGYFDTKCKSTGLGYNDSISSNTSNLPRIFVSVLFAAGSGGPGSSGGAPGPSLPVPVVDEEAIVEQVLEQIGPICGDNVCGDSESPLSCGGDCKINLDNLLCVAGPQCNWRQSWFAKTVVAGIAGVIIVVTFVPGLLK